MKAASLLRLYISNSDGMKKFLLKTGVAAIGFASLIMGVAFVLFVWMKDTQHYDKGHIFVWGDSQMYQGLDVSLLGNKLHKPILTSAMHGSGVYDFLISAKNIPENAICIVSFPEHALLRRPTSDYHRTGLELSCIRMMLCSGCPISECLKIFNLNKKNSNCQVFYRGNHDQYPYADTLALPVPLYRYRAMFSEKNNYTRWKTKAYGKGIRQLSDKGVRMVMIKFPFEKQVEDCAYHSTNRCFTDSYKNALITKYAMKHHTVVLSSDSLLMHDLTHLNGVGARMTTMGIADILLNDTVNNLFVDVIIR